MNNASVEKWIRTGKAIVCALAAATISSCGQLELEDVSDSPEHKAWIGSRLVAKKDLLAISVTADANYAKRTDYIVLMPPPGFAGPEVVATEAVRKGESFRVIRVVRTKSVFIHRTLLIVDSELPGRFGGYEVRLRVNDRLPEMVEKRRSN